jgi:hypothetical protein
MRSTPVLLAILPCKNVSMRMAARAGQKARSRARVFVIESEFPGIISVRHAARSGRRPVRADALLGRRQAKPTSVAAHGGVYFPTREEPMERILIPLGLLLLLSSCDTTSPRAALDRDGAAYRQCLEKTPDDCESEKVAFQTSLEQYNAAMSSTGGAASAPPPSTPLAPPRPMYCYPTVVGKGQPSSFWCK